MPKSKLTCALLILYLLSLLSPVGVSAQTAQSQLHISDTTAAPEPVPAVPGFPGLSLELTFDLLNGNGEPATAADVDSASLKIGEEVYIPVAQKLEAPWSIVILMDGSGTVGNFRASDAFRAARTALRDSVDRAPRDSSFAVLQFNDLAPLIQDFTRNLDIKVKPAIRSMQPKPGSTSCLYNGVYEAVNKLKDASGRRAVILFTASADNCAQRQPADVIALAQQNHVRIYAVGLDGYTITEAELNALVGPTGGLASLRDMSNVAFGINNIMALLNNQWQAKTVVYPAQGQVTAELSVTLKDTTTLASGPITFTSDQTYTHPPQVKLKGQVQPTLNGLTFNLDLLNPELIHQLDISVISKKTGSAVYSESFDKAEESNKLKIPDLVNGDEYQLSVTALDDQGQPLSKFTADFRYEPAKPELRITTVEPPTIERKTFLITLGSESLEGVATFKLWLVPEDDTTPIEGSTTSVPVGEPLAIPAGSVPSGAYRAVVQALDSDNTLLVQVTSDKVTYHRPNPLDLLALWAKSNPLGIVAIALVCGIAFLGLMIVLWLILPKRAARPATVDLALPEKVHRAAPAFDSGRWSAVRESPSKPQPPVASSAPSNVPANIPVPAPPPTPTFPKACLSIAEPAQLSLSVEIKGSPFTIGRREGNDWVITLDNKWGVSGKHASVTFANGRFYIEDHQSTYGTQVNGQRIAANTPMALEDGALIGLGPMVKVKFKLGSCL